MAFALTVLAWYLDNMKTERVSPSKVIWMMELNKIIRTAILLILGACPYLFVVCYGLALYPQTFNHGSPPLTYLDLMRGARQSSEGLLSPRLALELVGIWVLFLALAVHFNNRDKAIQSQLNKLNDRSMSEMRGVLRGMDTKVERDEDRV